jgi:hypothetical protein
MHPAQTREAKFLYREIRAALAAQDPMQRHRRHRRHDMIAYDALLV